MLSTIYFGNTVEAYLISLLIIIASLFFGRTFNWFAKNVLLRLVRKSQTRLDDIFIEQLDRHIAFLIFLFGLQFGISLLSFSKTISFATDQVLFILMTLTITHGFLKFVSALIDEYLTPFVQKKAQQAEKHFMPLFQKIFRFTVWMVALILILNHSGYNVTSLLAGLGLGGLAFAMASKDYISNIFGGMTVFTDGSFRIGDRIRIGEYDGYIKEIGLRSTRLKTFDGTFVTIPNSHFTENIIENISNARALRIIKLIKLDYKTSLKKIEKAKEILAEIVKESSFLEEKNNIIFYGFNEYSLDIEFIFYIKHSANYFDALDSIYTQIYKRFTDEELVFAIPLQIELEGKV